MPSTLRPAIIKKKNYNSIFNNIGIKKPSNPHYGFNNKFYLQVTITLYNRRVNDEYDYPVNV